MKKFLLVATLAIGGAVFALSVKNSSLENLRANAVGIAVCKQSPGSDCASPATGTIYINYSRATVNPR
jgi:hypothetical protein